MLPEVWSPHPTPVLTYPELDSFSDFPQDMPVEDMELAWPQAVPPDPYPYTLVAPGEEWLEDTLDWSHYNLTFPDHSTDTPYPLPEASPSAFEASTPSTSSQDSSFDYVFFAGMNEISVGGPRS